MLHLFNSCYLYPDILFEVSKDFVVVGKNHKICGSNIDNSFYHMNSSLGECFGRYESFEQLQQNLPNYINSFKRITIFADDEEFIKIYTSFLKTQIKNLSEEFYLQAMKMMAVKLKIRNRSFYSQQSRDAISILVNKLIALNSLPDLPKINVEESWVKQNAGIEWQLVLNKFDKVDEIVNRYVYSHFNESKIRFLSRKDSKNSWVEKIENQSYDTVTSMPDLYQEMRKEQIIITDKMIMDFYSTKDYTKLVNNPKFLLLLKGGQMSTKNWADKVDIWLLRWMLKMDKKQLLALDILA